MHHFFEKHKQLGIFSFESGTVRLTFVWMFVFVGFWLSGFPVLCVCALLCLCVCVCVFFCCVVTCFCDVVCLCVIERVCSGTCWRVLSIRVLLNGVLRGFLLMWNSSLRPLGSIAKAIKSSRLDWFMLSRGASQGPMRPRPCPSTPTHYTFLYARSY